MAIRTRTSRSGTFTSAAGLIAAVVLGSGSALAQVDYGAAASAKQQDAFSRPGGYISLGVGGANPMFTGDFSAANDFLSQALIIGIRGGQRFNRFLAADLSLDYSVKGFEAQFTDGSSREVKSVTGFGNLKLYPFGGRIQPYAMGGVGVVWGAVNAYDSVGNLAGTLEKVVFAGRAGGGLDFYITPHVALSGEVAYVIPTNFFSGLNYLSYTGHLLFRF